MQDYTKLSHEEKEALVKKAMDVGFPDGNGLRQLYSELLKRFIYCFS